MSALENEQHNLNSNNVDLIKIAKSDTSFNTQDTSRLYSKKTSLYGENSPRGKKSKNKDRESSASNLDILPLTMENNPENNNDIQDNNIIDKVESLKIDPTELILKNEIKKVIMRTNRKDYFGTNIIKGHKQHKVTFIDKVKKDKKLCDIIFIENIKNILKSGKFDNEEECKCIIF